MVISIIMCDVMTRINLLSFKLRQFICTIGTPQAQDYGVKENKSVTVTSCSSCLHVVVYRPPERLTTDSRGWVTYSWCVMLQEPLQVRETKKKESFTFNSGKIKIQTSIYVWIWINLPTWCNIYCIISARHVSGSYAPFQEQVDVIISYIYSIWCPWCSRCRSWGECVLLE